MPYRLITCPETAHLEMIKEDPHPLGLLILSCTRFRPACNVQCPRTCAARLDRRAQLDSDPTYDDDPGEVRTQIDISTELEIDRVREISCAIDAALDDETPCERPFAIAG
ncbi:MAG: hypothetical protein K8W52_12960 [Deltaproteobacteria bacterium]|nr:hypothetical protein [Deltaproteobacteria bacterium]